MNIGPFSEEGNAIDKIHKFIEESKGDFDEFTHKHHEIYLIDCVVELVLRQQFMI